MARPTGESELDAPRLNFDRRLKLEFHGSNVTSDAGLLPFRELDDILGFTELAGATLSEGRRGKSTRPVLSGLLRRSVFARSERRCHDDRRTFQGRYSLRGWQRSFAQRAGTRRQTTCCLCICRVILPSAKISCRE